MAKYDDASWHYEGDYPSDLPNENAATHIGIFLAWCMLNNLCSEDLCEDCEEEVELLMQHKLTGAEFLISCCDERLLDDDLNDEGNAFATAYYEDETPFAKAYASYLGDYCEVFDNLSSIYKVENTWESYERMAKKISERFEEWKNFDHK